MAAPFPVFGFMIDDSILHFHFCQIEIPLEIRHIIPGVPETKFEARKQGNIGWLRALVFYLHLPDFESLIQRDKITNGSLNLV